MATGAAAAGEETAGTAAAAAFAFSFFVTLVFLGSAAGESGPGASDEGPAVATIGGTGLVRLTLAAGTGTVAGGGEDERGVAGAGAGAFGLLVGWSKGMCHLSERGRR